MDAAKFSSSITQFSARFCNELEKGSVVSSPLSAEYLLAMLTLGAGEPAHSELLTALGIPDDDAIRSSFTTMSSKIKAVKGVTLNVANKVYIMEGPHELVPTLSADAVKVFDATFEKVNFAHSAGAASLINKWVESKTNNKIKNLLSPDSLSGDTGLVLVNAIYFKGSWSKKFNASFTMNQPFHVNSATTINVPMMYREDNYRYGYSHALQAQLLEMTYEGKEASMVIVLPDEIEGLNGVLQKLADGHNLLEDVNKMFSTKVEVKIPKFKIETKINLNKLLPKLGIKAIFIPGESGLGNLLTPTTSLFVSKAVQKAFIEVNEEGAEAAAATAMVMMVTSVRENLTQRFVADRPFLAAILFGGAPYFLAMYHGKDTNDEDEN